MLAKVSLLFLLLHCFLHAASLQDAINNAPPFATLKLSKGVYKGNILITKPLTIIGDGSIIRGSGKGNVITIKSSRVILKNLTVTHSGFDMTLLDSAIYVTNASDVKITGCTIEETLYGINFELTDNSLIVNNRITSVSSLPISQKGGGIKLWASHGNTIKENSIHSTKNNVVSFSNHNSFIRNEFRDNMFALHISNSKNILIDSNSFHYNTSAVTSEMNKNVTVSGNTVYSCSSAIGVALLLKGGANLKINGNDIRFNPKAIFIDSKFLEEGTQRVITHNTIAYNKEAFHFHQAIKNNTITHNIIKGNIQDVTKGTPGSFGEGNIIELNYWDNYAGFDRDNDGIGDTPYEVYSYSDRLWHHNHKLKYFIASPILSIADFILKIAPFIPPQLLLRDEKPLLQTDSL